MTCVAECLHAWVVSRLHTSPVVLQKNARTHELKDTVACLKRPLPVLQHMLEAALDTVDAGVCSGDADAALQASLQRLSDPDNFDDAAEDDDMEGGDLVLDASFANPCVRERGAGKHQVKPKRRLGNVLQPSAKSSASARNAAAGQTKQAPPSRCASHHHAGVFCIIAAHAFALRVPHSARVQVWQRRHLHRTAQLCAPAWGHQARECLLAATTVGRVVRGGCVWRLREYCCSRGCPVRQAQGLPRSSAVSNDASHGAALGEKNRGAAEIALARCGTSL